MVQQATRTLHINWLSGRLDCKEVATRSFLGAPFLMLCMSTSTPRSVRTWYKFLGILFWCMRVYMLPISLLSLAKGWMASLGKGISYGWLTWDTSLRMPSHIKVSLSQLVGLITCNPWKDWVLIPRSLTIDTDASTTGGSVVSHYGAIFWFHSHKHLPAEIPWLEMTGGSSGYLRGSELSMASCVVLLCWVCT